MHFEYGALEGNTFLSFPALLLILLVQREERREKDRELLFPSEIHARKAMCSPLIRSFLLFAPKQLSPTLAWLFLSSSLQPLGRQYCQPS